MKIHCIHYREFPSTGRPLLAAGGTTAKQIISAGCFLSLLYYIHYVRSEMDTSGKYIHPPTMAFYNSKRKTCVIAADFHPCTCIYNSLPSLNDHASLDLFTHCCHP